MVLSDGRLRERYDRQLEQWELERRMREKMMEEERRWAEEQRADNKFARDPIYRKKREVLDGDRTNKFGGGRTGGGPGPGPGGRGFGARPLEVDEEAEAARYRREEASYVEGQMAAEAEREARMRRDEQRTQLRALEEKQRIAEEREREERRRASSERDVIQDKPKQQPQQQARPQQPQQPQSQSQQQPTPKQPMQSQQQQPQQNQQPPQRTQQQPGSPQDMNAMMADMKQKFGQKKMDEAATNEAARVQGELERLSFGEKKEQSAPTPAKPRSVLFPGKGGIVVEDSNYVAKDILLDKYLGRPPSFISWVPPEEGEEDGGAADNVRAAMGAGGTGGAPPAVSMSGEREREQERLRNIRSRGVGGANKQQPPSQQQQQQPIGGFSQNRYGPMGTPPPMSVGQDRGFGEQLKYGPGSRADGGFQPPPRTSSQAREEARLQGMKAQGQPAAPSATGGGAGQRVGPTERSTLGTDRATAPKTSATERERRRLQNMKAMGQPAGSVASAAATSGRPNAGAQSPPPVNVDGAKIRELREAHRVEMEKLKSEMEETTSNILEEEIVKIAKIHAAEITKLKNDFRRGSGQTAAQVKQLKASQAKQLEAMRAEITTEVERDAAARMSEMQTAHEAEVARILEESRLDGGEAVLVLRQGMEELKRAHFVEMEDMAAAHDEEMARLRGALESRCAEMAEAHRIEIEKLTQSQKAASVAGTLKFQETAMEKLNAQHKKEMDDMTASHEQRMEELYKELEEKSLKEAGVKVAEATKSMAAQHKMDMEKMAAQQKADMDLLVQTELQKLKEQHAREMEEALADKRRLEQQQEKVARELKQAEQGGSPMTKNQKIEMVLQSFEGVYDPALIERLRTDLRAREEELEKQIFDSKKQISTLESKLDSSKSTEEKLTNEIRTLTKWREDAEAKLQSAKQGDPNQVAALNETIRSMTMQIAELKSQLEHLGKERLTGKKEISELREWKKNAEVERDRLEKELRSKDGDIAKLKDECRKRDEDVNVLVPEVCCLHYKWRELIAIFNANQ